jgi:hypothetical protein
MNNPVDNLELGAQNTDVQQLHVIKYVAEY